MTKLFKEGGKQTEPAQQSDVLRIPDSDIIPEWRSFWDGLHSSEENDPNLNTVINDAYLIRNTGITTYSGAALVSQAQSYNLLLNQLNFDQKTDSNIKWNIFLDSKNLSISIEGYQKLLTLVKERLEEYKLVLLHKLNKAK